MIYASKFGNLSFGMSRESIINWHIAWPKLFLLILTGYQLLKTHPIMLDLCFKKML
ncbi:hypothetical protein Gotri_027091, partial [Gossypium trilobum]|nr:hypothetical protein [Gossypium trilobum]